MAIYIDTNSDDIANTTTGSIGGANQPSLTMGWFKPLSSLVTSATFCGIGATPGVDLALGSANASKFRAESPTATTTWVWESNETGVFVLNEWTFWAFLHNAETTTDTHAVAAWAGTIQTAPTQLTMTVVTTGAGNVGGGGAGVWGTDSSSSTRAQLGLHDNLTVFLGQGSDSSGRHPWLISTTGALTSDTIEAVYRRYVLPYWAGNIRQPHMDSRWTNLAGMAQDYLNPISGVTVGLNVQLRGGQTGNAQQFVGVTGTGAVATSERGPRAYTQPAPCVYWRRR